MPIGPKTLLELVKKEKLIENLSDRELNNPEGAGFDIRLGEVHKISGKGFLGLEERKTPDSATIKKFNPKMVDKITINPGDYYLVTTIESVNLPIDIAAHIYPRSTLFRSGLLLLVTQVAPGYSGPLSFGLTNLGGSEMDIDLGARIAHIQFQRVEGKGNQYRGQWQGGRVSATKKEKQV